MAWYTRSRRTTLPVGRGPPLGYFTLERTRDENAFIIPRVVLNYGLFKNWEGVAEFAIQRAPDAELDVIDPAISLKDVLKEGVLQDKDGFGFAVEASALLPSTGTGDRRFGFEGIGILTDKLGRFGTPRCHLAALIREEFVVRRRHPTGLHRCRS